MAHGVQLIDSRGLRQEGKLGGAIDGGIEQCALKLLDLHQRTTEGEHLRIDLLLGLALEGVSP